MEGFSKFINGIADFFQTKIDFLNLKELSPAIYIAVAGALLVFVAFVIALIARGAGKTAKYRKFLDDTTAYINAVGTIDENNVEGLNARIQQMPRGVSKGWGVFLEQQDGYPSNYITEKEGVGDRKTVKKAGRVFYSLASAIVILLCIGLAAIACKSDIAAVTVGDPAMATATILKVVLPVLGTLVLPLLVYFVFLAILNASYQSQYNKLCASFRAFQDAMDEAVIIFREEEDEFVTENIEEINAAIEEILANANRNVELIDIVTTPKIDTEEVAPVTETVPEPEPEITPEPEPVPEPDPEPAPAPAPEPAPAETVTAAVAEDVDDEARKRGELMLDLVDIAQRASMDKSMTSDQLFELAEYLYSVKVSGDYDTEGEQEVFDLCLTLLANSATLADKL